MIGIDVSVSADVRGQHLYVTGVEDKVKLLEGLIKSIDQPEESLTESTEPSELRRHLVEGGNVDTVYNVLQTLLAGRDVRLSVDAVQQYRGLCSTEHAKRDQSDRHATASCRSRIRSDSTADSGSLFCDQPS